MRSTKSGSDRATVESDDPSHPVFAQLHRVGVPLPACSDRGSSHDMNQTRQHAARSVPLGRDWSVLRDELSRACYALWTMKVTKRCAINMAKATECSPTRVSAKRS
jgi:hypothetical protein